MNRQKGAQRREQLLEVAMRLFSAHGFEGTSTRAIAEAAGVNEALIFHYFSTKLALFHAVIVQYGVHVFQDNPTEIPAGMPPPEALSILCREFLNAVWKNRVPCRMLLGAALNDPVANDNLKVLDKRLYQHLTLVLKGYEASGEIGAGTAAATATVLSYALRGFIFVSIRSEFEDWDAVCTSFVSDLITVTVIMPG